MTQIESPKIVKKKLFSPIWLLPIVALALGAWLGVKSINESGTEIVIHFPNAIGIDIGKTLVKYQGLNVGKVTDIGLDDDLKGVNVKVMMDYRANQFLNKNTMFWLVKPKASITGVEGLDTLFSGNYIAIQPGDGRFSSSFEAQREAPAILPSIEGVIVELNTPKLGSLDVGSPVFFRQVPVGSIVSYRLEGNKQIIISAFIQEQYAHLVKKDSRFWNVSGITVDASLAGIKVNTESIVSILAGGISFSNGELKENAQNGDSYLLYSDEDSALGGIEFALTLDNADDVSKGTSIVYRGITVGEILQTKLSSDGVILTAKLEEQYKDLLTYDSRFWIAGAQLSLTEMKHLSRLVTGNVINVLPGKSPEALKAQYVLEKQAPDLLKAQRLQFIVQSDAHVGITQGAEVRFKQLAIGQVTAVNLTKDFEAIEYQVEVQPEFSHLVTSGSYFIPESAVSIDASMDGVSVKTRDLNTMVKGAISLVPNQSAQAIKSHSRLVLYPSLEEAKTLFAKQAMTRFTLTSIDGAGLSSGAPVFYKKMQIGTVDKIEWQAKSDKFTLDVAIDKQFASLIKPNTVFWRNNALDISASLSGVNINVAPLAGAIKGSISLGFIDKNANDKNVSKRLYDTEQLAIQQAKVISLQLPATAQLADKSPIRFRGHQIGVVQTVKLNENLNSLTAKAYLYGEYAGHFLKQDTEYFLVEPQISLAGIKSPETLITGPYLGVLPGKSDAVGIEFTVKSKPNNIDHLNDDVSRFTLIDSQLGSIKAGTPIFFRGIAIGQVDDYQLTSAGNQIEMFAHIKAEYAHLVNQSSQFWNASGIKMDVGLFSGAQIETESLETILAGGIAVVTQDSTTEANALTNETRFTLHANQQPEWIEWQPSQTTK